MPHFYVPPENISNKTFRITGDDVRYLITVRRYAVGDKLRLFDGRGTTMLGEINAISKDEIKGFLIECTAPERPAAAIHLYQAMPKGERFDWLVEKAAELGVEKIIPLVTGRSVIKEASEQKIERWRRLAKAACQQCGRSVLMEIEKPVDFYAVTQSLVSSRALNIIPWEAENTKTFKEVFEQIQGITGINIFIGPEGGFSVKEMEFGEKHGLTAVTLGARILRSETAGLLSAVLALNLLGEFGRHK